MKVAAWLQRHPGSLVTVSRDLPLQGLVDRVLSAPCVRDLYVVDDDGRLIGHISHARIAQLALAAHRPFDSRRQIMHRVSGAAAGELMRTSFPTARPDEDLDNVLHRQLEHDVEDMPVVAEDGAVLGAVNLSEVLRAVRAGGLNGE